MFLADISLDNKTKNRKTIPFYLLSFLFFWLFVCFLFFFAALIVMSYVHIEYFVFPHTATHKSVAAIDSVCLFFMVVLAE